MFFTPAQFQIFFVQTLIEITKVNHSEACRQVHHAQLQLQVLELELVQTKHAVPVLVILLA